MRHVLIGLALAACVGSASSVALAQKGDEAPRPGVKSPASRGPQKGEAASSAVAEAIRARNAERMKQVSGSAEARSADARGAKALAEALAVQDWVIAFADPKDIAAFREAGLGVRAAKQLGPLPSDLKAAAVATFDKAPGLRDVLLTQCDAGPGGDNVAGVYTVLKALSERFGPERLDAYANLAAALCVVHDAPMKQRVNENTIPAATASELFEYFTKNEGAMRFGLKNVPPELLIYVVDVCAPVEQLQWALGRYAKSPIGPLYMQVRYDNEHAFGGKTKKVTEKGFSLQNIVQFGGVCADQAYFASTVGKACGVPSVYVTGMDTSVGHAWLGTLKNAGSRAVWDFDTGRWPEYKNVRGNVDEPQYRTDIADGFLTILTEGMNVPRAERQGVTGLADAALRVARLDDKSFKPDAAALGEALKPEAPARSPGVATALELLEAGVRKCPAHAQAWATLTELATDKKNPMTVEQRGRWANAVVELCGERSPDYAFAILSSLVGGMDDAEKQAGVWRKMAPMFLKRKDLEATARFAMAQTLEKAGKKQSAWEAYNALVNDRADDVQFITAVLARCQEMLEEGGHQKEVAPLFERAWRKIQRPQDGYAGPFATQSNWYRVGTMLADAYEAAGDAAKAKSVRAQLDGVRGK